METWKQQLADATRVLVDLDPATSVSLPEVDAVRLLFALASRGAFELVARDADWSYESGRLRTALGAGELPRRVVALRRAAVASRIDRGVHALYLGLGMLTWCDASGAARRAPLWLQPVELERAGGTLRLCTDSRFGFLAPRLNAALADALLRDHALALDSTQDLSALIEATAAAVATRDGWHVASGAALAVLPVAELAIALDVAALALPRGAVAALATRTTPPPPPAAAPAVSDIVAPLDADADQLAALVAAADAPGSVVVHAPPGTGATQTIANLVAHAAATGRSLLVVSDRASALDAVHQRLATIGLDELALRLHADVDAADHVAALARVLERAFRPVGGPALDDGRLAGLRGELEGFVAAFHAVGRFGRSVHAVLGRLVELRTTPRAELADADAATLDGATFQRRAVAVAALADAAVPVEPVATHPWRRSTRQACDDGERARVVAALAEASAACAELVAATTELVGVVPGVVARGVDQLAALGALCHLAASSPRPGAELIGPRTAAAALDLGEVVALIRARGHGTVEVPRDPAAFVALAAKHRTLVHEVAEVFTDAVDRVDVHAAWQQLKRWSGRVAPLRYMALRTPRAELDAVAVPGAALTDDVAVTALEAVIAERACRAALDAAAEPARRWFGALGSDPRNIDGAAVEAAMTWANELRRAFDQVAIVEWAKPTAWRALVAQVAADPIDDAAATIAELAPFRRVAAAVAHWQLAIADAASATGIASATFTELAADGEALVALREQLDALAAAVDALPAWAAFHAARDAARSAGAVVAVAAIERGDLAASELAAAWERATLLAWVDDEHASTPALARFHGTSFDAHIAAFADLDRGAVALSRARTLVKFAERLPRLRGGDDTDPVRAQATALIAAARARTQPLRDVLAAMPELLPRLAPAILATPAAIAQHLDPALRFDVVVLDEAAHLPAAFALGALARADGVVAFGDARQGDGVLADLIAAGATERALRWHHRSRHDELIAPVSARFYQDALCVVPAASSSPDLGIAWREADAAAVAADVVARLRDPSQRARSLAVVALTRATAEAIEDLLDAARAADPTLDAAFEAAEPVVVRHVDAAAGLERDVVIVHADHAAATERQLAIALTRAREQLVIASAGEAHPIAAELAAARAARDGAPASPVTAALARALAERGWIVRHGIGAGPYRLDLAIVDPSDAEGCVLAIEHDGAAYASGGAARDRDRLRAQELVALGWRLHRVWTIDWWLDPEREVARAHGAIVAAMAANRQRRVASKPRPVVAAKPTAAAGPSRAARGTTPAVTSTSVPVFALGSGPTAAAAAALAADATPALVDNAPTTPVHLARGAIAIGPYMAAAIPAGRRLPDDLFATRHGGELGKVVEQVLAAEAPIHIDLLARRVAAYFGIGRTTANGQRVVDQVRAALAGRGQWGEERDIVWRLDQDPTAVPGVRVAGAGAEAKRDIGEVPLSELAAAARIVVERAALSERAVATTDLVRDAARLLGFARLTERVVDRIARGVRLAELRELIVIKDGRASL
jgi:hypothetical protein